MESKDVSISLLLRSYVTFTHIKSSIIEKPYTHIYVPFFHFVSHIIRCERQRLIARKIRIIIIIAIHIVIIFMNCRRLHQTWWHKKQNHKQVSCNFFLSYTIWLYTGYLPDDGSSLTRIVSTMQDTFWTGTFWMGTDMRNKSSSSSWIGKSCVNPVSTEK